MTWLTRSEIEERWQRIAQLIAFESVYSMDGDMPSPKSVLSRGRSPDLSRRSPRVGMYGPRCGIADATAAGRNRYHEGTSPRPLVDGGYIAATPRSLCHRSLHRAFFTTSIAHPSRGATTAIRHLKASSVERQLQSRHAKLLTASLNARGLPVTETKAISCP